MAVNSVDRSKMNKILLGIWKSALVIASIHASFLQYCPGRTGTTSILTMQAAFYFLLKKNMPHSRSGQRLVPRITADEKCPAPGCLTLSSIPALVTASGAAAETGGGVGKLVIFLVHLWHLRPISETSNPPPLLLPNYQNQRAIPAS